MVRYSHQTKSFYRQFQSASFLLRQAVYDYNKVKQLTQSSESKAVLIDVREADEYNAGYIPTAKNLPLSNFEQTLKLSPDEFKSKLGFDKPEQSEEVVFYCKSGVRSTNASNIAEKLGFSEIGNYKGSWLDWSSQSNSESAPNPNQTSGKGEGAAGGIDLKAMNQKEEARAKPQKEAEKQGKPLESAGAKESESVRSGAELAGNKKFE